MYLFWEEGIFFSLLEKHIWPRKNEQMTIHIGALKLLSTAFSAYMLSLSQQWVYRGNAENKKSMYAVLTKILLRANSFFLL